MQIWSVVYNIKKYIHVYSTNNINTFSFFSVLWQKHEQQSYAHYPEGCPDTQKIVYFKCLELPQRGSPY